MLNYERRPEWNTSSIGKSSLVFLMIVSSSLRDWTEHVPHVGCHLILRAKVLPQIVSTHNGYSSGLFTQAWKRNEYKIILTVIWMQGV
jgi:hypothetical protein